MWQLPHNRGGIGTPQLESSCHRLCAAAWPVQLREGSSSREAEWPGKARLSRAALTSSATGTHTLCMSHTAAQTNQPKGYDSVRDDSQAHFDVVHKAVVRVAHVPCHHLHAE